MTEYLTEKSLGPYLEMFVSNWIRNKQIPGSNVKYRPDYRNEELKLIVEFDGPFHFTKAKQILIDWDRDLTFEELGYTVKQIPYFVQICPDLATFIFGNDIDSSIWIQTYPHGFIDEKAPRPCDFCSLGLKIFDYHMHTFGPYTGSSKTITDVVLDQLISIDENLLIVHDIPFLIKSGIYNEQLEILV